MSLRAIAVAVVAMFAANALASEATAQFSAPVKYNSYVIQFKPNATPQQRNALLAKYGLRERRSIPSLNIVVVERIAPGNEPEAKNLNEVFNPPIIRSLRKEPIVATATVDSASSPRVIPNPSDTKFKAEDGTVHQWSWTLNPSNSPGTSLLSTPIGPQVQDGNWGLKAIRMPPVWTIIQNFRAKQPGAARPKLAIVDTGFSKHQDLEINLLPTPNRDGTDSGAVTASVGLPCERAHGNHVAGIAGAIYGNGIGIDGVIPGARIDAIPVTDNVVLASERSNGSTSSAEGLAEEFHTRNMFFNDVIFAIISYVESERAKSRDLRVVNISMGLNLGTLVQWGFQPEVVKAAVKDTLVSQALIFVTVAAKYENDVLFVVAAGNDSEFFPTPIEARWSSGIAWLAKGELPKFVKRPRNILVVEATDRSGQRAELSNIGGHVAAPGVDILSTAAEDAGPYIVCRGTSQAAPFAAALATLLFELDPTKKPAEIIDIMVKSAIPRARGSLGAPRLDALESVLRLSPYIDGRNENLVRLTDLNGDGKVDVLDMQEYARRLAIIADNRANDTPFREDLNGDKATDGYECNWPTIDFNGSGSASLSQSDVRRVLGEYRNDLAILQLAWTDKTKSSAAAIKETGLDEALRLADLRNQRVSPQACR